MGALLSPATEHPQKSRLTGWLLYSSPLRRPHDVLIEAFEQQGSVQGTADTLNVDRKTVSRALARGAISRGDPWFALQLLALWELWKSEEEAIRSAKRRTQMKDYRDRNK